MLLYTAFTAYTATSTVFAVFSVPKPFISTVRQLNIANTSKIFSNVSSKVDSSIRLSAVETKVDTGLVLTSCTIQTSRLTSSIYKHCCTATKEEKERTKKTYFYKYCPP